MALVQCKTDGTILRKAVSTDTRPRDYFQTRRYRGRVNCANCGSYYMQLTGEDEPEHLVVCKKCDRQFVWMVREGCVLTIGSPMREDDGTARE